MGKSGKREFVQVLRSCWKVYEIEDVAAGVRDAIERGVIGFDSRRSTWCYAGSSAGRAGSI